MPFNFNSVCGITDELSLRKILVTWLVTIAVVEIPIVLINVSNGETPCNPKLDELAWDTVANGTLAINNGRSSVPECWRNCKLYFLRLDMVRDKRPNSTFQPKGLNDAIEATRLNALCFAPQLSLDRSDPQFEFERFKAIRTRSSTLTAAIFVTIMISVLSLLLQTILSMANCEFNELVGIVCGLIILFFAFCTNLIDLHYGTMIQELTGCENGVSIYDRNLTFPNAFLEYFCDTEAGTSNAETMKNIKLPDNKIDYNGFGQKLKRANIIFIFIGGIYMMIASKVVLNQQRRQELNNVQSDPSPNVL